MSDSTTKLKSLQRNSGSLSLSLAESYFSICYTPSWYHKLPTEVLLNVFKYFTEKELRNTIGLVCRQWRNASLKPELWKKLEVHGQDVPTAFICRKIRDFSELESIHANDITEPITVIRQICRCAPKIKHLAVRNCPAIPEAALRNLIQCCKKLETLDLSGTKFQAHRFYEEIAGLMHLRSVNLSKNSSLTVKNLLSIVLNCHKLEELKLSTFCPLKSSEQLSDKDASFIIWNLAPNLKSLTLDASTLTNFSFKAIMNCVKLETLGLYSAGNLSADVFTQIWRHLPNLKTLKIRHAHQITGQNIHQLFISGKHVMRQIVSIDFTGCWKITDIGIEAIADCCSSLQTLLLKSCKNLHNLQSIRDKSKLEKLDVAFCTNLDLHTILPLPESINIFVLHKCNKTYSIINFTNFTNKNLQIRMCLSEYNQEMENYTLD